MNARSHLPSRRVLIDQVINTATWVSFAVVTVLFTVPPQVAHRPTANVVLEKLDRAVIDELHSGGQSFRLLVRTRPDATSRVIAFVEARRSAARPVSVGSRLLAVASDRAVLAALSANPDVERISSDAPVQSSGVEWNRLVWALGMDYWGY